MYRHLNLIIKVVDPKVNINLEKVVFKIIFQLHLLLLVPKVDIFHPIMICRFKRQPEEKADNAIVSNKRRCSNARQVPPIEDYIKRNSHQEGMWNNPGHYDDERRRSLSPVEPTLNSGLPQVHIHQNNTGTYNNGRLMGTPSIPLPSVFSGQYNDSHNNSGSTSQGSSSSISALLNPSSPTGPPQLPPISSVSTMSPLGYSSQQHLPTAAVTDPSITQQVLQAHRQELQREVSHLSMLLNRTTAILVGLDHAMASNYNNGSSQDNNKVCTHYPSPPINAGLGQKSYMSNVTLPPLSPSSPPDSQMSR